LMRSVRRSLMCYYLVGVPLGALTPLTPSAHALLKIDWRSTFSSSVYDSHEKEYDV
jgi:hypothetical protein